ncbi:hypothetical protein SKAU_G00421540 [Synaphobranchus kaupii]|uniref:Uncharacterized protein n=1 Tax=Synaphobranchus kaupii TaxID=118154 RepID=A0A9Q1IB65_SYNKA|nr:hypothetical protein SKAU_G00421520 [Synaphobranchus kaupii]KAJ8333258.1 hypothetical protein SKAU_G00421540 [Synaphobranchus kaupii]
MQQAGESSKMPACSLKAKPSLGNAMDDHGEINKTLSPGNIRILRRGRAGASIAVLFSVSIAVSVFGSAHLPDLFFPHPPFLRYHPLCHTQAVIWRETQGDECKGERDG